MARTCFSLRERRVQLSFEDRTYLVTGGGSGIGKGVAAGLVAAGASVMIVGRNADRLGAGLRGGEGRRAVSRGGLRHDRRPERRSAGGGRRGDRGARGQQRLDSL